jgi:hypothetical protein
MSIRALSAAILLAAGPAAALDDAIRLPGDGGYEIEPPDPVEVCERSILTEYSRLSTAGINLGAPVGTLQMVGGDWCFQVFSAGRIYSTAPAGGSHPHAVYGAFLPVYAAHGYHAGPLGRPLTDPAPSSAPGALRQGFLNGTIESHPVFGTHAVTGGIAGLWAYNGREARFGYPLDDADPMGVPGGIFSVFENGFGAQVSPMGAWLDYTGEANEGQIAGSVTLYQHGAFGGISAARAVSSQSPVAFAAQLGSLDNITSSVVLAGLPARASVTLFDGSPMSGRSVRISGADGASVRVSNIGAWMNDRASSFIVANHGTASLRLTANDLRTLVQDALDGMDTAALMEAALEGRDASGSLAWTGDAVVEIVPGDRTVHISRRAYMDVDADCALVFNCNADGEVQFDVWLRPAVAGDVEVHGAFVRGQATSIACSGRGCADRADALASLFNYDLIRSIEDTVDGAMNARRSDLALLSLGCDGEINVRRIHVLPQFVEVVLADTAAAGACAANLSGGQLSTARPAARVENSDGTVVTTGVTTVSDRPVVRFPIGGFYMR